MYVMQAFRQFSLLVCKQNHSDLSLTALDNAHKRYYQTNRMFLEKKLSKSAKGKVNDFLATQSHQLLETD
jgi:hypothetical protein